MSREPREMTNAIQLLFFWVYYLSSLRYLVNLLFGLLQ